MEERARLIHALTKWTNSIDVPKHEQELIAGIEPLLRAEFPSLDITPEILILSTSIVVTENAEKVREEINRGINDVVKGYKDGPELEELLNADIEDCKKVLAAVGEACAQVAETIAKQYCSQGSATWRLLKIQKMRKRAEAFMLQQFKLKDVQAVQGLAGQLADFYANFTTIVSKHLQTIRDTEGESAPKLRSIWEGLYSEHLPHFMSIPNIPQTYVKTSTNEFKAAFLNSMLLDLEPWATTWIQQLATGAMQVFDASMCTKQTRELLLNAGFAVIPEQYQELRTELQTLLGVGGELNPNWERDIPAFQAAITLQEKYFTILCLVAFFAHAHGDCHYKPTHRTFNRAIILKIFAEENLSYPINDWILARGCEDYISTVLNDRGQNPYHHPREDMKARANEAIGLCDAIDTFELIPLTPSQFPTLHVTIVIPGWLSESKDLFGYWNSIAKYSYYGSVLGLQWEAGTMGKVAASGIAELLVTAGSFLVPGGLFFGPVAVAELWNRNPFAESAKRAVETGKFLAYYIKNRALGNIAVSLIGFSLGGRMVASVLTELQNEPEIYIQDAILIGGAVSNKAEKWRLRRKAVAGRLINVMSKNDEVLQKLYTTAKFESAAGANPILVEGVENFDASEYVQGHSDHPLKLDKTLERLNVSP